MTNRRAGKTNTRDPRAWHAGKAFKRFKITNRFLRRRTKRQLRKGEDL